MEGSDGVLGQVEGGEGAGKLAVDRGQVRSLLVNYVFIFITDGASDLDEDSLILRPINVTLTRGSQKGGSGPTDFRNNGNDCVFNNCTIKVLLVIVHDGVLGPSHLAWQT